VRAVIDDLPSDHMPLAIADAHSERIIADAGEPGCYHFTPCAGSRRSLPGLAARWSARACMSVSVLRWRPTSATGLTPRFALLAHHFGAALPTGASAKAIAYTTAAAKQLVRSSRMKKRLATMACIAHARSSRCARSARALQACDRARRAQMKAGHAAKRARCASLKPPIRRGASPPSTIWRRPRGARRSVWRLGLPGTRAIALLEASLEHLRDDDYITRARLQSSLARALAFAGERDRADRLQRETLQLARRSRRSSSARGRVARQVLVALGAAGT
jgi:hypothetical protein